LYEDLFNKGFKTVVKNFSSISNSSCCPDSILFLLSFHSELKGKLSGIFEDQISLYDMNHLSFEKIDGLINREDQVLLSNPKSNSPEDEETHVSKAKVREEIECKINKIH
jgi:hypothetical protein